MNDSQMKNVGQVQPAHKPTKDKIGSGDQQSNPRAQMSWGGVHTSENVEQNDRIADEIVGFHDVPRALFKQKSELVSNNKLQR